MTTSIVPKRCVFCNLTFAVDGTDFCSLECSRWFVLCERLKKIEGVLIELKYELKKSNVVGSWEEMK